MAVLGHIVRRLRPRRKPGDVLRRLHRVMPIGGTGDVGRGMPRGWCETRRDALGRNNRNTWKLIDVRPVVCILSCDS